MNAHTSHHSAEHVSRDTNPRHSSSSGACGCGSGNAPSRKRTALLLTLLLLIATGLVGCGNLDDLESDGAPAAAETRDAVLGSSCHSAAECSRFAPCVTGGSIDCLSSLCVASNATRVDLDCAAAHAAASPHDDADCGIAIGPTQQPADLAVCRWKANRPSNRPYALGWLQAVADEQGSTVTVLEATLYGIRADGSAVAIAGSELGNPAITWAGYYDRTTWFRSGVHETIDVPSGTFVHHVPTGDRLLHFGTNRAEASAFSQAVLVARVQTTGDARVQLGIDYWANATGTASGDVTEGAVSDWVACDAAIEEATPRSESPTDCSPPTHTAPTPAAIAITGFSAGEVVVRDTGVVRNVCWTSPEPHVDVWVESGGTVFSYAARAVSATGCQLLEVLADWPLGSTRIVAESTNGAKGASPYFTVAAPSSPPPNPPPETIQVTGFSAGDVVERGVGVARNVCWTSPAPDVDVWVESAGALFSYAGLNLNATGCQLLEVLADWPLGSTRIVAESASGASGATGIFTVVTPSAPQPSNNTLLVTALPALASTCGAGLTLITWDAQGHEINSSPGGVLALTVPDTWHGFAMLSARCGGTWHSWPFNASAHDAGLKVTLRGADLSSTTLVCHDPWGPGDKPAVPLDPWLVGTCP